MQQVAVAQTTLTLCSVQLASGQQVVGTSHVSPQWLQINSGKANSRVTYLCTERGSSSAFFTTHGIISKLCPRYLNQAMSSTGSLLQRTSYSNNGLNYSANLTREQCDMEVSILEGPHLMAVLVRIRSQELLSVNIQNMTCKTDKQYLPIDPT